MTRVCLALATILMFGVGDTYSDVIQISNDPSASVQKYPSVAMNEFGRSVICWQDSRDGKPRVYFQILDRNGYKLSDNQPVMPVGSKQCRPKVIMNFSGHFTIVWQDEPDSTSRHVLMRRFSANGTPLGEAITLSDGLTAPFHHSPDISATTYLNSLIVAWIGSDGEGEARTYYAVYSRNDHRLKRVQLSFNPASSPCTSMNQNGDYVVSGLRKVGELNKLWLVKSSIADEGSDIRIEDVCEYDNQINHIKQPDVALCNNGDYMICWSYCDQEAGYPWHIYSRYWDESIEKFKPIQTVSDFDVTYNNVDPNISTIESGFGSHVIGTPVKTQHRITWSSDAGQVASTLPDPMDVYSRVMTEGEHSSEPICLHDVTDNNQIQPCTGYAKEVDVSVTAWTDERGGDPDIYAGFLSTAKPLRFKQQYEHTNNIVLTWDHPYRRDETLQYNVYRATKKAGPYEQVAAIDLTDRGSLGMQFRSYVDTDVKPGIAYYYYIESVQGLIRANSDTLDVTAPISESGKRRQRTSFAEVIPEIDGVINPEEWRDAEMDTIGQLSTVVPGGCNMWLKNTEHIFYIAIDNLSDPFLDLGDRLLLCVDNNHDGVWNGGSEGDGIISLKPGITPEFIAIEGVYPNFLDISMPGQEEGVDVAMSDANGHVQIEMAIHSGSHIKMKPGQTIGFSLLVYDPNNFYWYHNGYLFAWELDVLSENPATFPGLQFAERPTGIDRQHNIIPNKFVVGPNYPNPFNATTVIPFETPRRETAKLHVFDIQGREILSLKKDASPGTHHFQLDMTRFPSGVYLYHVTCGTFECSNKMIYIR